MKMKRMVLFLGWVGLFFITLTSTSLFAEAAVDICGSPAITEAFNDYKRKDDRDQIKKIQSRLNELGNASIAVDGFLGKDTRDSLKKFCSSQNLTDKDALAETLVELLFKKADDKKPQPEAPPDAPLPTPPVTTFFERCSIPQEAETEIAKIKDDSAVYYRLREDDFAELAARDAILQQLETLKDMEYPNEVTLLSAVEAVLAEVTKKVNQYAGLVLKTAEQPESYRLTVKSFERLRLANTPNVPEAALERLQMMKNLPYPSTTTLGEAVAFRLKPPTVKDITDQQTDKKVPATQDTSTTQPEATNSGTQDTSAQQSEDEPAEIDYSDYSNQIRGQAEQVTVYQLTDQSFTELKANPKFQVIPAALLEMIGKLQDVEYIDRRQFIQAICGSVEILFRDYQNEIVNEAGSTYRLSDSTLDNLKSNGIPDIILEAITPLKGQQYTDKQQLKKAVEDKLLQLTEQQKIYDFYPVIALQARQEAPEPDKPIRWNGGSCGCSRELSHMVYGFYPFWLVDQDRVKVPEGADPVDAEQELDFSVLTRIGYYGVYLDNKGDIIQSRHWRSSKKDVEFAETAGKYKTKLDLVVYTNTWDSWQETDISNAAKQVAEELNLQLPPSIGDRLKSMLPFVDESRETLGDGVTLYFDDYTNPDTADARKHIASLITKVHQELQTNPKSLSLNIMFNLGWNELGEEDSLFKQLTETSDLLGLSNKQSEQAEVFDNQEIDKGFIDRIFILLEEPTTDTKKWLRSKIENEFKGEDRMIVLRKIIPIISPTVQDTGSNNKYAQFTDDLIYFKDNFAGVGLWPLPLAQNSEVKEVNDLIVKHFKQDVDQDFMKRMVALYIPQLCNYACPNRWQFRIAFDILAFLLILVGLVSASDCRASERIKKNPWPVMALLAVLLLVFGTSLVCDPFWNQKSDDVAIGLLGAVLLFGLWRYIRKINQGKLP